MLPARRNKVDISAMSEEEQKLFRLYGKLPTHKNVLAKMQKDRKFFDSGDYALSKAGKAPRETVGTAIPNPENIPHASPTQVSNSSSPHISVQTSPVNSPTSPVKESSLSQESTLADIMNTDPNPSDTTVETDSTVVEEVEEPNLANVPAEDAPETEAKATESGSGDSDIKMD
ncbi:Endosulfine-domain-containing protein [Thelephora terrestris]|uniref:mRNA stability protein n=1 Tax=Thelephora terrestris TaxID=56493 RepID=A0A9P6H4H1_9AGAM|nr:Endosulfine-domain-containing protein [Thelephora terrestris]